MKNWEKRRKKITSLGGEQKCSMKRIRKRRRPLLLSCTKSCIEVTDLIPVELHRGGTDGEEDDSGFVRPPLLTVVVNLLLLQWMLLIVRSCKSLRVGALSTPSSPMSPVISSAPKTTWSLSPDIDQNYGNKIVFKAAGGSTSLQAKVSPGQRKVTSKPVVLPCATFPCTSQRAPVVVSPFRDTKAWIMKIVSFCQ